MKEAKEGFQQASYCFCNDNTGLDTLIKINGYYKCENEHTSTRWLHTREKKINGDTVKSKSKYLFFFYGNGMAVNRFYFENGAIKYPNPASYFISGDTIKTLSTNPVKNQTHPTIYNWYKIINDTTLEYLGESYHKELDRERMLKYKNADPNKVNGTGKYSYAHFVPYDSLPNQDDFWIKNKKWFWCDKEEYKKWKKARER